MNDDTKNELEVNPSQGIQDNFKIETKPVQSSQPVVENNTLSEEANGTVKNETVAENSAIEQAMGDSQVNGEVPVESEKVSEATVVSETIINADINSEVEETKNETMVGSIEEVSVSVDSNTFNTLNEAEVGQNSVFNKPVEKANVGSMKEGKEYLNDKKGFPYFMVFIFVSIIVMAFFIDDIVVFIDEKINNANKKVEQQEESPKEEEKVVAKVISLDEIKNALENSEDVINYEKANNIELEITINDDMLTITTTNYLDPTSVVTTLKVDYVLANNTLMANCTLDNYEFGLQISKILVKEIAILQGVALSGLEQYIEDNLYTNTLDNGFEFTNSEDGNNTYQIAVNVKIDINK